MPGVRVALGLLVLEPVRWTDESKRVNANQSENSVS
jgi:hypothetical protein